VRIIVAFAAGGPTDVIARVLAPKLADYLKSDLAKWAKVVKEAGIKPE
jgi:tripartite-type tricarboxylate transporter receptor subunit TctC